MINISKSQRKKISSLISTAYERELDFHLEKLAQHFDAWRQHTIKGWELNDLIHEHHDGISRELYKTYNYTTDKITLLARAVHFDFLKINEIPPEFIKEINSLLKCFNSSQT